MTKHQVAENIFVTSYAVEPVADKPHWVSSSYNGVSLEYLLFYDGADWYSFGNEEPIEPPDDVISVVYPPKRISE